MKLDEAITQAKEEREKVDKTLKYWESINAPLSEQIKYEIEQCKDKLFQCDQTIAWLTELQERREADRWIPITERLPEKNGNYLVLLNNGEMTTDIFYEEELFMGFWGYMTHWRPLPPKPYESEAENETDN